jgi:hypothetical protein
MLNGVSSVKKRLFVIVPLALAAAYFSWRDATLAYWRNQAALAYDRGHAPEGIPGWVAKDPEIQVTANEAKLAEGLVNPNEYQAIADAARAALRIDPLNPAAVYELGMVAEHRQEGSGLTFFELAERLSRREVPNEIMLEQIAAQKGDIRGAVERIDHIVSVAPNYGAAIFPPMVAALGDRAVRETFMQFADRPWYDEFLGIAASGDAEPDAVAAMINAARAHLPVGRAASLATNLMNRVLVKGDFAAAVRLSSAMPGPQKAALAQIGFSDITTDAQLAPMSWSLANDEVTTAKLDGPGKLTATIGAEQSRQIAVRTTLLRPGAYTLMQTLSYDASAPRAGVIWDVVCAGPGGASIWHQPIPARGAGSLTYRANLTIPPGCEAQQWRLSAIGDTGDQPSVVTVGGLVLKSQ